MINYYELLGMIKEGNIPEKIRVTIPHIASKSCVYVADYDDEFFSSYSLEDREEEDVNYQILLSECFVESSMFDKCIEIIDDNFEEIKEIELDADFSGDYLLNDYGNRCKLSSHDITMIRRINKLIKNQRILINKLKEGK